ncbi:hypothetical protein [Sphingobacterium paucimobilis]|uniref:YtkA-like domain-containing protein n=1 Tax=Sphingobacterium paucimobilis HER1398 TaxID=1346330 RepID=U2HXM1_9SPHI|nr:hypothetical protein [Sphingobacterium paucimobilis]ERJ60005.1 hypothetical protein M472_14660 [Sphingobacterium paucimobilis HER1398]
MEKIILFLTVLCCALTSCTKEKTDYEAEIDTIVPERSGFKEVTQFQSGAYTIRIDALGGNLYKGYNKVHVKISGQGQAPVSAATLLPIRNGGTAQAHSCPHSYQLTYNAGQGYFEGYMVFTEASDPLSRWDLHIGYTADQSYRVVQQVPVQEQDNKNLGMTSFTGRDGAQYILALIAPQKPKVAENELVAGLYRFDTPTAGATALFPDPAQFSYSEVQGYTILLDPRMPEPSMGNHSSPNNKDLLHGTDNLYHGVVNYTMTGNWTLNFILHNQQGDLVRGTVVPDDFTPGVVGVKSELHIDILF